MTPTNDTETMLAAAVADAALDTAAAKIRKTLRFVRAESRHGEITWTSGEYRITRCEYTLPFRSTAYHVKRGGTYLTKRYPCDKLQDAKDLVAFDMAERAGRDDDEDARLMHLEPL